jgi:OOP family OmpA-OmpF porin
VSARRFAGWLVAPAVIVAGLAVGPSASADDIDVHHLPSWAEAAIPSSILDISGGILTLEPNLEDVAQTEGNDITLNSDILFAFGKAELTPIAKARIAQLTKDIPKGGVLSVVGYTDSIGSDAANLVLSKQRAAAVAAAITAARTDLRPTVDGKGEANPVEPNTMAGKDNPDGRAKNRRVEITVG